MLPSGPAYIQGAIKQVGSSPRNLVMTPDVGLQGFGAHACCKPLHFDGRLGRARAERVESKNTIQAGRHMRGMKGKWSRRQGSR